MTLSESSRIRGTTLERYSDCVNMLAVNRHTVIQLCVSLYSREALVYYGDALRLAVRRYAWDYRQLPICMN